MIVRRSLAVLAVSLGVGLSAVSLAPAHAAAPATVHPGVQTYTGPSGENQCTSNFIFSAGVDLYIGQAAHCAGTGTATATNGCSAKSMPLGTPVTIDGASHPGVLAYSSWLTMQARGERDPATCDYNDFALVKIDPADVGSVSSSVPYFGGPTGVASTVVAGADVYTYGNSSLRFGLEPLSPKSGINMVNKGGDWNHVVYTVTPGVPGDSGSGFLDADGRAFGVLSTLNLAPEPAGNGVADLARALDYLRLYGNLGDVQLVLGTEPFTPGLGL